MLKSPIDYFAAQDFSALSADAGALTEGETLFMRKYLGVVEVPMAGLALNVVPVSPAVIPADASPVEAIFAVEEASVLVVSQALPDVQPVPVASVLHEEDEELALRTALGIQFVGFDVGPQQYTLPTSMVQEVIRALPVSQLPMVSPLVSGVINLRGKVVPLVRMGALLDAEVSAERHQTPFTIICRGRGMQVGLQISRVRTMYQVTQDQIQWNVESTLGIDGECITGIFLLDERIMPILSVQRIVDSVLRT